MADNGMVGTPVRCEVARYTEADCLHRRDLAPEEALALCDLSSSEGVLWLNVDRVSDHAVIQAVARHFGMHPLLVEDVLHTAQRPKLEAYDNQLYLVARMLGYDTTAQRVTVEQVSLVLGRNWLVLFQENPGDVFDTVRHRFLTPGTRLRSRGADWLLYACLDALVDSHSGVLEQVDDRIEAIEESLFGNPGQSLFADLHEVRKQIMVLRRCIWPLRDAVNALQHDETGLVHPETSLYLRDVYDHTVRLIDTVETSRDTLASMHDLYLTSVSNRLNSVMKVLTIISTVFIPLSFVTGVFGMNFRHMLVLDKVWGYPAALVLMAAMAAAMLAFFKRKAWF